MNGTRFDHISRLFAQRRLSRRRAVQQGATVLAAGALATAGQASASMQDATPTPGDAGGKGVPFMFVQSFGAGELAPKAGEEDLLTLTVDHLAGQTVYFSDRPERIVGMVATERLLGRGDDSGTATPAAGLGFSPADPPNAALVFAGADGSDDHGEVIVVELIDPTYNRATGRATYDVRVLADYTVVDLNLEQQPLTTLEATREFEAASLFIDDCPDGYVTCSRGGTVVGQFPTTGFCYNWGNVCCAPCSNGDLTAWTVKCNSAYPEQCGSQCRAAYVESWACG